MINNFAIVDAGAVHLVGLDDPTTAKAQDSQPICERHRDSLHDASRVTELSNVPVSRSARCKTTPDSKTLSGIRFGGVLHSSLCAVALLRHLHEIT